MTEPATPEDIEKAKREILVRMAEENRETRAHIGSEIATIRGDVAHTKNYAERLLKAFKRFMGRHGMGSDDL